MASDDNEGMMGQRMPIKPGEVATGMDALRKIGQSIKDIQPIRPDRVFLHSTHNPPYIDADGVHFAEHGVGPVTEDAQYVLNVLPDIIAQFLVKNVKYAEVEKGYDLGAAGVIPDLNRKLGILVARLWKEAPTSGEETDEVIGDMIGHLLLMLAKMRSE